MNNRGTSNLIKIIGIGAVIAFFIILAVTAPPSSSSGGSAQGERGKPKYQFTVTADAVGLDYIIVINENTGAQLYLLPSYLPITLNFVPNDILTFEVYSKEGYTFNAWSMDDGTWESDNPLSLKPGGSFNMHALFTPEKTISPKQR